MKTLTTTKILLATAMIAGSVSVFAQSTGATGAAGASGTAGTTGSTGATGSTSSTGSAPAQGMGTSQQPAGVGVTPQTASDANSQAVPRSDTGTVVRTSPNAVDSTRNATGMTGSTGMSSDSSTSTGTSTRTARADRN